MAKSMTLALIGVLVGVLLTTASGDLDAKRKKAGCGGAAQAFAGVCLDREPRTAAAFADAVADCADEGKRLPTGAELDAFRLQPGVILGAVPGVLEWSGDIFDEDQTLAMSDGGFHGNQGQSSKLPYRCAH